MGAGGIRHIFQVAFLWDILTFNPNISGDSVSGFIIIVDMTRHNLCGTNLMGYPHFFDTFGLTKCVSSAAVSGACHLKASGKLNLSH